VETSDNSLVDPSNSGRNSGTGKGHRRSKDMAVATANKLRNADKSKEMGANWNPSINGLVKFSGSGKEQKQTSLNVPTRPNFMKCLEADFLSISLDDGGSAFSILNRNLPIYMNCPYCQLSKNKKDPPKVKFAGTLSQLQRIFLVHNDASLFIHFLDLCEPEELCCLSDETQKYTISTKFFFFFFVIVKDIILSSVIKYLMFRICLQVTPPFPVVLATCPVIQFAVGQPLSLEYIHQHCIYMIVEVHPVTFMNWSSQELSWNIIVVFIVSLLANSFLLLQILSIYY
jgi:hypothetical protein